MFESLSDRFDGIFSKLRGKGRLSEADVDEVMREIRVALLEADVNLTVVRTLVTRMREQLVGAELSQALNPSQQVIKAVNAELTNALGGETLPITFASRPPTVILMAGLQGAGKTTTTAKLARWFKAQGRNPLLVGADLQRPAAVEQLRVLGEQVGVPVYSSNTGPVTVAAEGLAEARRLGKDVLIVDTAGRLSIDVELMDEVKRISDIVEPNYTFLVIDAMTGQDAVNTALAFHQTLAIDGVIMTKLDGDARGGAALSVKEVIGRPIAFASTGEKLADFDQFHPDRMASRILGMGDVLTLIEQAESAFDQDQAEQAAAALMSGRFTLDDFLEQMQSVRKMGPMKNLLGLMPGMSKELKDVDLDERELDRVEAIIRSMTRAERVDPQMIDASRRQRIAQGSGRPLADVNNLLKQFGEMQKMMKAIGPAMMPKGGGALGKMKQARAIQKGLKDGSVNPEQLEALGLGGVGPGSGPGGFGGLGGGLPSLPALPKAASPGGQRGGGRVTAPGTSGTPKSKKKKKR
jgi:signal recognition particle subunit SRP54